MRGVELDDRTRLLVDGNNVMGAAADGWWRDPPAAVRRLLARLQCYASRTNGRVELVLDVRQPDLPEGDHNGVVVRYATRRGRDAADDRIVELLGDDNQDVEVVTSDRALPRAGPGAGRARRRSRSVPDRSLRRRLLTQLRGISLHGVLGSKPGSRGRPSTRSPTMFFWISVVPPAMVPPGDPTNASTGSRVCISPSSASPRV